MNFYYLQNDRKFKIPIQLKQKFVPRVGKEIIFGVGVKFCSLPNNEIATHPFPFKKHKSFTGQFRTSLKIDLVDNGHKYRQR